MKFATCLASFLSASFLSLVCVSSSFAAPAELKFATFEESQAEYDRSVKPLLAKHCAQCHGPDLAEKELELQELPPDMKATTSAARWAVVLAQLSLQKMPPQDEVQPTADARAAMITWIKAELKRSGKHVAMREEYFNGNIIEHALLFGGKPTSSLDAPARVRRLSPEIYAALTSDVGRGANVGQPFSPQGGTTFKDMGAPKLDEPTTSQLIGNALLIVDKLTWHKMEGGVAKSERGAPNQLVRLFDEKDPAKDADFETAITYLFDYILRRQPTADELQSFTALMTQNIVDSGRKTGVKFTLAAVLLLPEAVLRSERGAGPADERGLVRLAPREIAFAVTYALTDRRPESWLLADAEQGKLATGEGVEAAVRKMLDDPKFDKPRIMRFFREYFGYQQATEVFKNPDEPVEHYPRELVADTDRLIEWVVEQDKEVLRELLTTNKAFVNFRWDRNKQQGFQSRNEAIHVAYGLPPDWKWTVDQPIELPANQRAGILTQPAWLVAVSKSDDNDVIHRGKWIRERLLGNVVPDIPITVDAQLPVAPEKTLRERMAVTQEEYCWQCHRLMNRVGYPLEMYDHFGRFRVVERVLDVEATAKNVDSKGKPLGPILRGVPAEISGGIEFVGDNRIEGDVNGAVEFMHKLADSERVEQVFVRHAFRYWMGRNETPGDAASLQAAHKAYRDSGGSMKSLIAALLTSDSFMYRVNTGKQVTATSDSNETNKP
jgi:mono/diheme cytochrome c family protein